MTEQDIFRSQTIHRLYMAAADKVTFWDILDFAFRNQIELCIYPVNEWNAVRISMRKGAAHANTIVELDNSYVCRTEDGKQKFTCETMNRMLYELAAATARMEGLDHDRENH